MKRRGSSRRPIKQTKVEVKPREKKRAQIITELAQSIIQIEVMANKGKNPLQNAIVEIVSHRGIPYRNELTDANGQTNQITLARTTGKDDLSLGRGFKSAPSKFLASLAKTFLHIILVQ